MKRRTYRPIVDALLESMDVCDATRSHEATPHQRVRARLTERRVLRYALVALFSLGFLMGIAVRATTPSPVPAVAGDLSP
jgi:hypothetical protein